MDFKNKNKSAGTPIIYHYLKRYQEDPSSRVFAPLAEAYRKSGLLDEAIEIARDGIRIHPHFIGGRVALARALFDKSQFAEVVKELEPVVLDAPDNLVAQKLLAESYLILGRIAQALGAYKTLLFLVPEDQEIAKIVLEIEERAYEDGTLILQKDPIPLKGYAIKAVPEPSGNEADFKRKEWIRRIEILQIMLFRVQRFKLANKA